MQVGTSCNHNKRAATVKFVQLSVAHSLELPHPFRRRKMRIGLYEGSSVWDLPYNHIQRSEQGLRISISVIAYADD